LEQDVPNKFQTRLRDKIAENDGELTLTNPGEDFGDRETVMAAIASWSERGLQESEDAVSSVNISIHVA
jgi:hypothetical protein